MKKMFEKVLIFKINGKNVEIIDWDITIDEIEKLKLDVAYVNSVEPSEIEVDTIEIFKPEVSTTIAISSTGFMYKAPNQYSSWVPKDGLNFSCEIEMRRYQNGKEEITDNGLNILLEKIAKNCVDDVIIFS